MEAEVATAFVDTNLGTRLCFNAPADITVREFKKYFEREHFSCFPHLGGIQVTGVMVKEEPYFYHLANCIPMKSVFPGMREPWFLRVKLEASSHLPKDATATVLSKHEELTTCNRENKKTCSSEEKRSELFQEGEHQIEQREATNDAVKEKGNSLDNSTSCEHQSEQCEATMKVAVKEKGNCRESCTQNVAASGVSERRSGSFGDKPTGENKVENLVVLHANSVQGSQSKMSTQVISVTGLINKYFTGINGINSSSSDSDVTSRAVCSNEIEVQSNKKAKSCSKRKIDALPHFTPKTSKRKMKSLPQLTPKIPVDLVSKTSGSKNTRFIVGERLLSASKSFQGSITKLSPSLSVCRFNDGRNKSQINGSIFSISDSDN